MAHQTDRQSLWQAPRTGGRHTSGRDGVDASPRPTVTLTRTVPATRPARHQPDAPVALVTGASSGIGAAVARRLGTEGGWQLVLSGRDHERLLRVADASGGAVTLPVDLVEPGGCGRLAHDAMRTAERVDLLVAGAGIGWAGPFVDMPGPLIDRMIDVNLASTMRLVRLLTPSMVRQGRGHVVLIGSIAGCVGVRDEAVYSATKAALCAFADALRYEVAAHGVRVSVVIPGAVNTPFFERRGRPYQRSRPRPVSADRVAEAVWRAVHRRRDEVFVPGWLRIPGRLHGAAPGPFRRLAARFA